MSLTGADSKLAILMHGHLGEQAGKMGEGLLRYSEAHICAVIDRSSPYSKTSEITNRFQPAPIVPSVRMARDLQAEVLVIGVAPAGGLLPDGWREEIIEAATLGFSIVNPLHSRLESDGNLLTALQPGKIVWDVRVEPSGIAPASGDARLLQAKRVLTVGTDMSVGKMTASLELVRSLRDLGASAEMVATGQVGIVITGRGIPLDGIRIDFAAGAVEGAVIEAASRSEVLVIEGQGALCHPAAGANLPLIRGSMPSHLLLCHREGQTTVKNRDWVTIPALSDLIKLYEDLSECCGSFSRPMTLGVALNTAHLTDSEADNAVSKLEDELGLPVQDPVRHGCAKFARALTSKPSARSAN